MNNYVTEAINLKSYNLNDADKIMVMYSKENGLIKGVAKGIKKPKSKLGARMDLLVANSLQLLKGRSLDTIVQAQTVNNFRKTREDIDKLIYSSYISELVMNLGEGSESASQEIYELLYKALNRISEAQEKKDALIAVIKFQLKILLIMGFCVELDTCLCCREQVLDEEMYFSSKMGGILCKECNEHLGVKLKMHHKIRDFLQAMLQFDFDYVSDYDQKATDKVCQVCFDLLDEYIKTHTNKKTKSAKVLQELSV
ncbi:MAG: DNA repair protein RecO [Cyanobacteria bacterium SIG28]|nr:DNA repair protein RecO [Cyanobacteria bacterium SIG28]